MHKLVDFLGLWAIRIYLILIAVFGPYAIYDLFF